MSALKEKTKRITPTFDRSQGRLSALDLLTSDPKVDDLGRSHDDLSAVEVPHVTSLSLGLLPAAARVTTKAVPHEEFTSLFRSARITRIFNSLAIELSKKNIHAAQYEEDAEIVLEWVDNSNNRSTFAADKYTGVSYFLSTNNSGATDVDFDDLDALEEESFRLVS